VTVAPALEIAWSQAPGGETCIDRRELVAKVESVVGRGAFAPAGEGATVVLGSVGPASAGHGWVAVVEARVAGATATRREVRVDTSDCRQLDEAIVLVVALMADSTSEAESRPLVLRLPAPRAPASVGIGLDVAASFGMLPGVAVGVGLASEIQIPPVWPIILWTHVWLPSQALEGGSGGRLGAYTVGVGLCPLSLEEPRWALAGCLGASAGVIDSSGVALDVSETRSLAFAEGEIRARMRVRIAGPVFVGFDLAAGLPVTRYAYRFTQADGTVHDVFQTAPVIPEAGARLEVRVP
jgi:hypothetical protein